MGRKLRVKRFSPAGPTGAVIQAAERMGWTWPAWNVLKTEEGFLLGMVSTCPQGIKAMVHMASDKALWKRCAATSEQWNDLPQGPWLQPMMQVIGHKKHAGWTARHVAAVKRRPPDAAGQV